MCSQYKSSAATKSPLTSNPTSPEAELSPESGSGGARVAGATGVAGAGAGPRRVRELARGARISAATSQRIANGVQPGELQLTLEVGIRLQPRAYFLEQMRRWMDVAEALELLLSDLEDAALTETGLRDQCDERLQRIQALTGGKS